MIELEKRIGKLEMKKERGGDMNRGEERVELMEKRMREMKRKLKRKERDDRKRNIVIKGLRVEEGRVKEGIEKLMKEIGVKVKIGEIRRIRTGKEERGEMVIVRLNNEEERRKIESKRKLKGEKVWIMEDLTWGKRRTRWMMREIAKEEELRGNRMWVENDRITINGKWWFWDGRREVLVDKEGKQRDPEEGRVEGKGKGVGRAVGEGQTGRRREESRGY